MHIDSFAHQGSCSGLSFPPLLAVVVALVSALVGCGSTQQPPPVVEVRRALDGADVPPAAAGGCSPHWEEVELHDGEEPLCTRGKIEGVVVTHTSRTHARLRVSCGCIPAGPGPVVGGVKWSDGVQRHWWARRALRR